MTANEEDPFNFVDNFYLPRAILTFAQGRHLMVADDGANRICIARQFNRSNRFMDEHKRVLKHFVEHIYKRTEGRFVGAITGDNDSKICWIMDNNDEQFTTIL